MNIVWQQTSLLTHRKQEPICITLFCRPWMMNWPWALNLSIGLFQHWSKCSSKSCMQFSINPSSKKTWSFIGHILICHGSGVTLLDVIQLLLQRFIILWMLWSGLSNLMGLSSQNPYGLVNVWSCHSMKHSRVFFTKSGSKINHVNLSTTW